MVTPWRELIYSMEPQNANVFSGITGADGELYRMQTRLIS